MKIYSLLTAALFGIAINATAQDKTPSEDVTTGMYLTSTDSFGFVGLDTNYAVEPGTGEEWMIVSKTKDPATLNGKSIEPLSSVELERSFKSVKKLERYLSRYLRKERKWLRDADGKQKSIVLIVNESGKVSYLKVNGRYNWYYSVRIPDFNRFEDALVQKVNTLTLPPAQKDGEVIPYMVTFSR